jgi:hypothetical protein
MKKPACLAARLLIGVLTGACVAPAGVLAASHPALATLAEKSDFEKTGRYAEVERLCAAFAKEFHDAVRCFEFGRTPEGRPMLALVATRTGALTPQQAHKQGLPVMLMQGGIHAGEIDGKDAGFLALRQMLDGEAAQGALKSFVLVFVPVYNIDGHERFGRWNRPNQVGPEEMGWRVTAQNYNLNRDYVKADAPETQAMLRLLTTWDPVLYVDLHVTDGAEFQHDISNTMEPIYAGDPDLHGLTRSVLGELNRRLSALGSMPVDFYPDFVKEDDPASGFAAAAITPRYSTGYWALHNRFAILVETHSWKDYPTRVKVTRNTIVSLAEMIAKDGARWRREMLASDQRAAGLAGQSVPVDYDSGPHVTTIDFRGYAYTRDLSPVSGALVTHYDPAKPQIWHIPFKDTVVPKITVRAPKAGYVVPAAYAAQVAAVLSLHGIRFTRIPASQAGVPVEAFRATHVTYGKESFEGHIPITFAGAWKTESRDLPAGSLFVPVAQPAARLVLVLLDPQSPDSLAALGLFNSAFEEKEYMEPYVAEKVAEEMLAQHPDVAREFKQRIADDPQFAASPSERLDFFYRLHPSHDERLNLYPVYRVDTAPPSGR